VKDKPERPAVTLRQKRKKKKQRILSCFNMIENFSTGKTMRQQSQTTKTLMVIVHRVIVNYNPEGKFV
jgi:hypothetical protein